MAPMLIRGVSVISVAILAACGGGGSNSGAKVTTPANQTSIAGYNALVTQQTNIVKKYVWYDGRIDRTFFYEMPTSGKATYRGTGAYSSSTGDIDTPELIGKSVLTADFGKDKLTGKVTNFKASQGHRTSGGTLNVNTDIEGANVSGRVTGNLNLDGRNIKINDAAIGGFMGRNAEGATVISGEELTPSSDHTILIIGKK